MLSTSLSVFALVNLSDACVQSLEGSKFGPFTVQVCTEPAQAQAHLAQHACDALLLETNHDREMLAQSAYPAWLKRRIGGQHGHLANDQSASLLAACRHDSLRHVVAAHLSRQNNRPALALAALQGALGGAATQLTLADAALGCAWIEIG